MYFVNAQEGLGDSFFERAADLAASKEPSEKEGLALRAEFNGWVEKTIVKPLVAINPVLATSGISTLCLASVDEELLRDMHVDTDVTRTIRVAMRVGADGETYATTAPRYAGTLGTLTDQYKTLEDAAEHLYIPPRRHAAIVEPHQPHAIWVPEESGPWFSLLYRRELQVPIQSLSFLAKIESETAPSLLAVPNHKMFIPVPAPLHGSEV